MLRLQGVPATVYCKSLLLYTCTLDFKSIFKLVDFLSSGMETPCGPGARRRRRRPGQDNLNFSDKVKLHSLAGPAQAASGRVTVMPAGPGPGPGPQPTQAGSLSGPRAAGLPVTVARGGGSPRPLSDSEFSHWQRHGVFQ